MVDLEPPGFAFIVDTDSYAGNFESELSIFLTGCSEEAVGVDPSWEAELPEMAENLEDQLVYLAEEGMLPHCHSIYPTPGKFSAGMGGEFDDGADPQEVLKYYQNAVRGYYERHITYAEGQILAGRLQWQKDLDIYKAKIAEAEAATIAYRGPFYGSVAIFFGYRPTNEVKDFLKSRAALFCEEKGIHIRGFRLLAYKLDVWEEPA